MNHCVPTWHIDGASLPFSPEFVSESDKLQPIEKEVQELVWRNGRLDTQNFNQKTPRPGTDGFSGGAELGTLCIAGRPKQDLPESDNYAALLGSADPRPPPFIQEDEMASWLHYPLEDTVDYRDLFGPPQAATAPVDRNSMISTSREADLGEDTPRPHVPIPESKIVNFSLFAGRTAGTASSMGSKREETVSGSLFCDRVESTVVDSCVGAHGHQVITPSSHHPSRTEPKAKAVIPVEGIKEPARSTSDRHGSTLVSAPSRKDRKRKAQEAEDSDSQSEDAYEDRTVSTKIRPSRAKRRNRAAEVHNLSERRRRDRINEKMRALQELIPRCNKSDKASMLDEAIEYLKSLQLQVQMMSVGCGMPQMLYPGLQFPLMPPPLGMGMVPAGSRHPAVMPFPPVIPRLAVPSPGAGPIFPSLPPMARLQMNGTEPIMTPIQPATLAEYQQYLSQLHMAAPTTRVPLPSSASVGKSGEQWRSHMKARWGLRPTPNFKFIMKIG